MKSQSPESRPPGAQSKCSSTEVWPSHIDFPENNLRFRAHRSLVQGEAQNEIDHDEQDSVDCALRGGILTACEDRDDAFLLDDDDDSLTRRTTEPRIGTDRPERNTSRISVGPERNSKAPRQSGRPSRPPVPGRPSLTTGPQDGLFCSISRFTGPPNELFSSISKITGPQNGLFPSISRITCRKI